MIPRRSLVVLATFMLSVLLYVDRACISTAKEAIVADLVLTDRQWGVVMSAFAFGYALLQTPTGALADRLGARSILASVVTLWSIFTGLTAAAWNFTSLVVIRFLFGAGEAGAFPGVARVVYAWFPVRERGLVKGINFSGARLGAAATMPLLPWMIERLGWKESFLLLMLIGFAWSIGWWLWFRDDPAQQNGLSPVELDYILSTRQKSDHPAAAAPLNLAAMFRSGNLWLAMGQYFASNFTFFFTLTWLYPYIKNRFQLESVSAGLYAMAPLIAGALGNVVAGWWVDSLYRCGWHTLSRRLPAIVGFALAAFGLILSVEQADPLPAVAWLSLAIFGADMTLAPSWSFCIDIGGRHSGAVSGTMNMAGNLGSAFVGLVFPVLVENYGPRGFFFAGAALNMIAVFLWLFMTPQRVIRFES
jgi:ACS family glucarate transporter-like MFS transporter